MMILGIPVIFMDANPTAESVKAVVELVKDPNTRFVAGAVLASALSYLMFSLAGKERSQQNAQFMEFHRELVKQNNLKDERISQLHSELLKRTGLISELQNRLPVQPSLLS